MAEQTGVSYGSTGRALQKHLHLHCCKLTSVHELKERDKMKRVEYCRWFTEVITANAEDILVATFFTNEAWFRLSGYVKRQNRRLWSATNPHEIKDTPLNDRKFGVWCAISRNRIIGPIFSMTLSDGNVIVEWFCSSSLDI
jgi:hypothetical protein